MEVYSQIEGKDRIGSFPLVTSSLRSQKFADLQYLKIILFFPPFYYLHFFFLPPPLVYFYVVFLRGYALILSSPPLDMSSHIRDVQTWHSQHAAGRDTIDFLIPFVPRAKTVPKISEPGLSNITLRLYLPSLCPVSGEIPVLK